MEWFSFFHLLQILKNSTRDILYSIYKLGSKNHNIFDRKYNSINLINNNSFQNIFNLLVFL